MASFVSGYSTLTESLVLYNAQIFPWLVHLASLLIFTIVCYIVVFSIRKQLIGNIEALEDTVETLNVRNELLEKKEAEIRQFAYFDTLTTLPNRYFFGDYVQKRLSVAESGYIALLDIRDFKMINSIYGTEVGDEILRELGILMNSFQKSPNLIARLSANEFAGWAEDWDHAHFLNRIADFNALINEKLMALTHKFHLDFYFVYARYPEDGHDFDTLFKHATVAMKFAKDRSTTEYIEFLPSMLNEVEDEERYKKYAMKCQS